MQNENEENEMPKEVQRNPSESTPEFKIPNSPSPRLPKLRISLKKLPQTYESSQPSGVQKVVRPSPLKHRNSIFKAPRIPPSSPRTPRRTCKDEALAKILNCFEKLSTSPTQIPHSNKPRQIARRLTERAPPKTRKPPKVQLFNPLQQKDESDSGGSAYSSENSDSSNSEPSFGTEDTSSELSTSTDSSDSSDDVWSRKKRNACHKRGSEFKKAPPTPSTFSADIAFVPKRSGGCSTYRETLNLKLQASRTPECLPCREKEFDAVFEFLFERLQNRIGGCMYISGVPGTGKTATVTAVLNSMRDLVDNEDEDVIPPFQFISINGMQVSEPRQAYVQIYEALKGTRVSANKAMSLLETEFCTPLRGKKAASSAALTACVLLIDELDLLCSRRQDVLYSLFDWPCRQVTVRRPLIVLAIANTMDLPERLLHHRVASRLGLNRLPFTPYSHEQLSAIVMARLGPDLSSSFAPKAIELATRKVAAVSGDARRALDICRRAAELAQIEGAAAKTKRPTAAASATTTMQHINAAICEMFASVKLTALRSMSHYEKLFLRAVVSEMGARGVDEVRLDRCMVQMYALCNLEGLPRPTDTEIFAISAVLGAYKIILTEPSRRDTNMLIRLNCSQSDVLFALKAGGA